MSLVTKANRSTNMHRRGKKRNIEIQKCIEEEESSPHLGEESMVC